jgi:hypothetical protein
MLDENKNDSIFILATWFTGEKYLVLEISENRGA